MDMKIIENWALHAYADGELEGVERAEVEMLMANSPEVRDELEAIKRQKLAIKRSFDGIADEPVPHSILRAAKGTRAPRWPSVASLAAGFAMLAIGAGSGWFASEQVNLLSMASLPERAFSAYEVYAVEVRHPVEVPASEQDHLQAWLSKRVGSPFKVPDLSSEGYTLLGGRLLADGAKPAGLLVYEDANKRRLTVFVASNAQKNSKPYQIEQRGKLVTCYWLEKDLVYALVGEDAPADMKRIAEFAHDRFES
jgi:anti-sigma factor RsiW